MLMWNWRIPSLREWQLRCASVVLNDQVRWLDLMRVGAVMEEIAGMAVRCKREAITRYVPPLSTHLCHPNISPLRFAMLPQSIGPAETQAPSPDIPDSLRHPVVLLLPDPMLTPMPTPFHSPTSVAPASNVSSTPHQTTTSEVVQLVCVSNRTRAMSVSRIGMCRSG